MKWRKNLLKLKTSVTWAFVVAVDQTAVNLFIPGVYRREWKNIEGGNVELVTIKVKDDVTGIDEVIIAKSRLVQHNERLVYSSSPVTLFAVYNAATKQLMEIGGSRILTFFLSDHLMVLNKVAFVKISNNSY